MAAIKVLLPHSLLRYFSFSHTTRASHPLDSKKETAIKKVYIVIAELKEKSRHVCERVNREEICSACFCVCVSERVCGG
jgi:hypothetical protein